MRTLVAALALAGISLSGADAWAGCSGTSCVVDTTEDTLAGAQTSLRDAMTYANSNPGTSITFSLPANSIVIAGSAANGPLPAINADTIISGAGVAGLTISGSNTVDNVQNRVFFVLSGTVAISDLAIVDGKATGGAGGNGGQGGGGGGGMGAGGAIYAATTSAVTISNVSFSGNQATGGAGGVAIGCCEFAGGGGGGLGGSGGNAGTGAGNSGAGGGGGYSGGGGGGTSIGGTPGDGGAGPGGAGGSNAGNGGGSGGGNGGNATWYGGGGGGGGLSFGAGYGGGHGGDLASGRRPPSDGGIGGGGGGAGGYHFFYGGGGGAAGGRYGGGGGGGAAPGANGGFGGGGGAGAQGGSGGWGGFGGGAGGWGAAGGVGATAGEAYTGVCNDGGGCGVGGSGASFGGAVFAENGASITITTTAGNNAGFGSNAVNQTGRAAAFGSDLFIVSSATATLSAASGTTLTLAGTIADDSLSTVAVGQAYTGGCTVGQIDWGVSGTVTCGGRLQVGSGTATGTVFLQGANSYGGGTALLGGTLKIGNGGALGGGALDMAAGTTVTFDNNNYLITNNITVSGDPTFVIPTNTVQTLSGVIGDDTSTNPATPGDVVVTGGGTLILSGANTYSGGTRLDAGALQVGVDTVLNAGSIVSSAIGTGTLTFNGGTLQAGGNYTIANAAAITAGGTIDANGHVFTYAGVIADGASPTGGLTVADSAGSGRVVLTAVNTYTGGTSIIAGTLALSGAGTLGAATNSVTVNGATAVLDLGGTTRTQNGGVTLQAGGTIQNGTLSSSGSFDLQSGSVSAVLAGAGGVSKTTAGAVTLSGASTYSGGTTVSGGTLTLSGAGTLGGIGNAVTVSGGTLNLGGTVQTQNGGVHLTGGAISNGTLSSSGSFDLQSGSAGAVLAGTGGVSKTTAGTVTLSGANTYDGGTTISAGTLALSGSGTLGNVTQTTMVSGTGTLDLGTTTQTQAALNQSGGTVQNGAMNVGTYQLTGGTLASTATINATTAFDMQAGTIDGVLAGAGAVTKTTAGIVTFAGINTYTGGTTISAGTLALGGSGTLGDITGTTSLSGTGTLDLGGTTGVTQATLNQSAGAVRNGAMNVGTYQLTGGTLTSDATIDATTAFDLRAGAVDGVLAGAAAMSKTTAGTVTLTNVNTYTGGTTISAGTLVLSGSGSIAGHLVNDGTFDISTTTAGASIAGLSGAGTVLLGSQTLTLSNATGNFSGSIHGGGGLTLSAGTAILSGVNAYTGATTINGGTLTLAATGSVVSDVTNAATFSNSGAVSGTVSNAAAFINNATGTVSGLLTNTAGSATNAGQLNGGALISGGVFTQTSGVVGGGFTNSATVHANGGSINGAIANNAGVFAVGGAVTSDSTFTNTAGATLGVDVTGHYTLQGLLTNSGVVTVANGGQLTASVGGITNHAGGQITVFAGGTITDTLNNAGSVDNGGLYHADANNLSSGTIVNRALGAWTGNLLSNAGRVVNQAGAVWTGNAANGATGTLGNFGTWTGSVANAGAFVNSAGATVNGSLTNTAGITDNAGIINGPVTVNGGTLMGAGTAGAVTMASGATFAPGSGTPGTSMTAGSLALQPGAIYRVQLNPTTASFADVTGAAALNGATVNAVFAGGTYISKQYTILTAASIGGSFDNANIVNGGFTSATVNTNLPSNFRTALSYDATHAYLDLILNFAIPAGLNRNAQNVGDGLTDFFNTTGGIPIVFSRLNAAGLTQASGQSATGSQQATFNAMTQFIGVMTDPLAAGRATGFADQASAYAATREPNDALAAIHAKAPLASTIEQRWGVWGAAFGGSQTTDGNNLLGSNTMTSRIYGTAAGADYHFSRDTVAGFALAGGGTSFSVNGLGSGRSDLFQAGAFIRHHAGPAHISAAMAYGWQDVTTDRSVTIAGIDRLRGRFNANAYTARVEGGYRFAVPVLGGFTPYAAGQFTAFELPAYAERVVSGTNTFGLAYGSSSATDTRSELGVRSDKTFAMGDGTLTLRGRAAWAHDFNPDRDISATFQMLPGASFVVNGAAQARDSVLTTASAERKWWNGWSVAATFEGEFSGVTRSYAGKGRLGYAW